MQQDFGGLKYRLRASFAHTHLGLTPSPLPQIHCLKNLVVVFFSQYALRGVLFVFF